jgi:hypothetical protein
MMTKVQHLRSFSSSCQKKLFPSSSYCRLKLPLLPKSIMTFSSIVLPPLSTFFSSTTLPPPHKNIFLYSLVLPQQSFFRLYCPLLTISYSCPPPPKSFPPLVHLSSLASLTAFLEARWMCDHIDDCFSCSQPPRVMPSRLLYAFSSHICYKTFHLCIFSDPV